MKQTAVDWLIDKLDTNLDINHSWRSRQYIEQAKQMEKEQIIRAIDYVYFDEYGNEMTGEQYYNETFKSE